MAQLFMRDFKREALKSHTSLTQLNIINRYSAFLIKSIERWNKQMRR